MKTPKKLSLPSLSASPFAPAEVVADDNLSKGDRNFLEEREKTIEAGRATFLEVGRALMEIRDHENGILYKNRHGTFEDYCRERWEFGRAHAYRLMDAAEIYTGMSPRGDKILPTSEKQLRALKPLSIPLRKKAWAAARRLAEPGEPQASDVQRAVREIAKDEGIELRKPKHKRAGKETYRLEARNLDGIRLQLAVIRSAAEGTKAAGKIADTIHILETFLPE